MIIDQLVGFLMVESVHPGSSLRLAWVLVFFCIYLFQEGFNDGILLVIGDVSVDSEASVVTLSHRDRVCLRVFVGVSMRAM